MGTRDCGNNGGRIFSGCMGGCSDTLSLHLKNMGVPRETMCILTLMYAPGTMEVSIHIWNWGKPFNLDLCDMHRANMIFSGISRWEVLCTLRALKTRRSVRV